jgi:hypothetical protein
MIHYIMLCGCDTLLQTTKRFQRENTMKALVTVLALAALVATPALAQTKRTQAPRAQVQQTYPQLRSTAQRHSDNTANDVYDLDGSYVGSDPDPQVRDWLKNDLHDKQ